MRSNPAIAPDDFDTLIDRHKSQPVSYDVFGEAFNVLLETMANTVKAVKRRSDALEARVMQLEQQPPSPHYAGTYEQGKAYARGALATRSGALWLALEHTTHTPGRSDQWKLIVKSGEAR